MDRVNQLSEIKIVNNRKAGHEFHFLTIYEAGIQLTGTEIKSVRLNQVNLSDAYCLFLDDELFVRGMHIAEYKQGNYNNHETKRDRKLLLNKAELRKLKGKVKQKGFSIVPTKMYISNRGFAKLEIALAKGKKLFDKRQDMKEKDLKREMDRES
jgi:SsrA-binding protein